MKLRTSFLRSILLHIGVFIMLIGGSKSLPLKRSNTTQKSSPIIQAFVISKKTFKHQQPIKEQTYLKKQLSVLKLESEVKKLTQQRKQLVTNEKKHFFSSLEQQIQQQKNQQKKDTQYLNKLSKKSLSHNNNATTAKTTAKTIAKTTAKTTKNSTSIKPPTQQFNKKDKYTAIKQTADYYKKWYISLIKEQIKKNKKYKENTIGHCQLSLSLSLSGYILGLTVHEGDHSICQEVKEALFTLRVLPISTDPVLNKKIKKMTLFVSYHI